MYIEEASKKTEEELLDKIELNSEIDNAAKILYFIKKSFGTLHEEDSTSWKLQEIITDLTKDCIKSFVKREKKNEWFDTMCSTYQIQVTLDYDPDGDTLEIQIMYVV